MTTALRRWTPAQLARRARKIARRRRDLGKAPLPPQQPIDREMEASKRKRIRARRAEAIRRKYDDRELAARIIRMLGLPRTVKKARAKRARKAPQ